MNEEKLTDKLKKIKENNRRNADVEKEFTNLKSEIDTHFQRSLKRIREYTTTSK
ncbi:MAG: hypothetical protein ACI9V1_001755 [Spirosomataceae bacterium]|jgi:hypothetical protein